MGEFFDQLQKLWPLIMQAPWAFAALATSLLALGFFAGRFAFSERIANLKSRLEMRDDRISALSARLLEQDTAPAAVQALPATSAPPPTTTPQPPLPSKAPERRGAENDRKPTSLRELLIGSEWYLYFGPGTHGGKKLITFLPDGTIAEGQNNNEYRWSLEGPTGELLTIYRLEGNVQNVFYYSEKYGKFEYMPDARSRGKKDQSIEPARH